MKEGVSKGVAVIFGMCKQFRRWSQLPILGFHTHPPYLRPVIHVPRASLATRWFVIFSRLLNCHVIPRGFGGRYSNFRVRFTHHIFGP